MPVVSRTSGMCLQNLDFGNQSAPDAVKSDRWYYNKTTQSCQQFTYYISGGRDIGNENNFKSKEDCEWHCNVPQQVNQPSDL